MSGIALLSKFQELQAKIKKYKEEQENIVRKQDELKRILYGRFGDSINLEN